MPPHSADSAFETDHTPRTTLGHIPAESTDPVTLDTRALRNGCYIEGSVPDAQTHLCTNLMAQWAGAGYGFCYVHPDSFATLDVLHALPDDRLEDVVWLNLRPKHLADEFDVPTEQRIALDPIEFDADQMAPEACKTYPTSARVADYLEVLAHDGPTDDWNVGSLLATVLDQAVLDDATSHDDLLSTLQTAGYDARFSEGAGWPSLRDWIDDQAATAWYGGLLRAEQVDSAAFETAYQLLSDATLQGEGLSPLRGPTSCSLQDCVHNDAIILVTGDLPAPDETGTVPRMRRLATRLLATVVVRRVWEGLQSEAPSSRDQHRDGTQPIYPVVLDSITRLFAHEPHLLSELLDHGSSTDTTLALVCNGRSPSQFGDEIQAGIAQSLSTRIVFEEQASEDVSRSLRQNTDIAERSFAAAHPGQIAAPTACWLNRNAAGMVTSPTDLGGFEEFVPSGPPAYTQSREAVEEAIHASQRRYGTAHPMADHYSL